MCGLRHAPAPTDTVRVMPAARYLTLDEAAEYIRVSPRFLRSETSAGRVVGAKVGRRLVYTAEDLDAYVVSRRPGGTAKAGTDL